jgi:hypothetical protein
MELETVWGERRTGADRRDASTADRRNPGADRRVN